MEGTWVEEGSPEWYYDDTLANVLRANGSDEQTSKTNKN